MSRPLSHNEFIFKEAGEFGQCQLPTNFHHRQFLVRQQIGT